MRTSKRVLSYLPSQKPFAAISKRAPSWVLEEAPLRCSPVIGCRSGSTHTSLHTFVRRFAVKSLISLCLIDGKPPFGQERACSIENLAPQPHVEGVEIGIN